MSSLKFLPDFVLENVVAPVLGVLEISISSKIFAGNRSDDQSSIRNNGILQQAMVNHSHEEIEFYLRLKTAFYVIYYVLCVVAITRVVHVLQKLFFTPLDRIRKLGSIGYLNHEAGVATKKETANMLRKRRKIGENLPPVFPNGWFRLFDSQQLKAGEVKEISAMGQHFAVFRSSSGKAHVLDAYCPHMGGNLAVGGRVKGDCLECPFHGWVFDGEGTCVKIPYAEKIPSFAKTKSWPCREVNGIIHVWYHCDDVEPEWEIPEITEISQDKYHYRGRVEHHVNTHIQVFASHQYVKHRGRKQTLHQPDTAHSTLKPPEDIPENGSDLAHLDLVHAPNTFLGSDLSTLFESMWNFAEHIYKAVSKGSEKETPHIQLFDLTHEFRIFQRWSLLPFNLKVYQIGPGIVHLHFDSILGKGVFVQSLTPVEPLHQVLTHNLYATWRMPTWIGKIFLTLEGIQVDRDIMIWNNKTFACRPKLVKEDSLIAKYRRWFAQFYTENSPCLKMKAEDDHSW